MVIGDVLGLSRPQQSVLLLLDNRDYGSRLSSNNISPESNHSEDSGSIGAKKNL